MEIINNRRSIRKYIDKPVEDEKIRKLLVSAMQAPSAVNQQPWEFIVVKDKATLTELSKLSDYAQAIANATVAIVLVSNSEGLTSPEFWEQDMSAATENILLEAVNLGLGAVWLGITPREDRIAYVKKFFDLPDNITPFTVVPVGYSDRENKFKDRYNEEKVHYEKW